MPGEELIQRGYLVDGKIKGEKFGGYEMLEFCPPDDEIRRKISRAAREVLEAELKISLMTIRRSFVKSLRMILNN